MSKSYTRPAKTQATALGERERVRWTRRLRTKYSALISSLEVVAAEKAPTLGAIHRHKKETRRAPRANDPQWVSIKIRIEQMAVIEMLQSRHLKATDKEISRAEVLAALMSTGLGPILNHPDFSGALSADTAA